MYALSITVWTRTLNWVCPSAYIRCLQWLTCRMLCECSLSSCVLALVVILLVYKLCFLGRTYSPSLPPSPGISLPIIGHLYMLEWDTRKSFSEFRKKCGDVYTLQLGSRLGVVISGYSAMKEGFRHRDQFMYRPRLPLFNRLSKNMG